MKEIQKTDALWNASCAWEQGYETLVYTALALETQSDDVALEPIWVQLRATLVDWEGIEAERKALRRASLGAQSQIRMMDAALDRVLQRLATKVLHEGAGRRDDPLYLALFPTAHEDIIELGLDGELPAAGLILAQLQAEDTPAFLKPFIAPLTQCLQLGQGALSARVETYASMGRLRARMESWEEEANARIGGCRRKLSALAEARGLSSRWVEAFFD